MELSQKDIVRYRRILLETFKAFSDLCEKNGLKWYMAFGSAIGTVRHGGFIPWDDDIDVLMPRQDYERFLGLKVHGYRIVGLRAADDQSSYPFPYAKFCDGNSTIWERSLYPCVFGVFVDVFPMDDAFMQGDGTSVDKARTESFRRKYRLNFRNYRRSLRLYQPGECRRRFLKGDLPGAAKVFLDEFWYAPRGEKYLRRFMDMEEQLARNASSPSSGSAGADYAVYGTSVEYRGVTLSRSWFGNTEIMPFEDTQARMPSGYDEMLRTFYGNYMELPCEEQRKSNHFHYFVDLGKALGIDEVTELLP